MRWQSPGGAARLSPLSRPVPEKATLAEFLGEGLTYDDVLLVPQMASALPRDVETKTRL